MNVLDENIIHSKIVRVHVKGVQYWERAIKEFHSHEWRA